MYFFVNLTIKSFERPRWYHSAVFIGSPVHVLRIALCDFENMFRAELYGKRLKEFEASGFPSCILNNAHFFETSHKNQKSFMMSGKVGTFSKQNGICRRYFFLMRILYTKLQSCSLCYRETNWFMQKIPSVTGIICAKCQNYNICMQ